MASPTYLCPRCQAEALPGASSCHRCGYPGSLPGDAGATAVQPPAQVSPEARRQALAQHIATAVATQGARVESQSDFQAVLLTGQVVNHVLHAILTLFTCGIWGIVWLLIVLTGGVKRHLLQVDDYGNVLVQHV
jgi:hypothetical protein